MIRSEPTTSRFEWKNARKDRTSCGNTEIDGNSSGSSYGIVFMG